MEQDTELVEEVYRTSETVLGEHRAEGEQIALRQQGTFATGWESGRRVYFESQCARADADRQVRRIAYEDETVDHHGDRIDHRQFGDFEHGDLSLDEIRAFFRDEQSEDDRLCNDPPETDGWTKQKYYDLREQAELGNKYAEYRLSRLLFDENSPYYDSYDGACYLESSAKKGYYGAISARQDDLSGRLLPPNARKRGVLVDLIRKTEQSLRRDASRSAVYSRGFSAT